ncbi:MAG: DUF2127 domain-containing protein [Pseudonocardiaceae bacterium]
MASASESSGEVDVPGRSTPGQGSQDQGRLLPVLAVERLVRATLLVAVGLILLTHVHADWSDLVRRFAERVGLDPSRNETGRLISGLTGFGSRQARRDGAIAIGYGALEAAEGYGLSRRRKWGAYLTVLSTALLFIPEVQELHKHPTGLKAGALALNVVIVGYLVIRLLRQHPH